MPYLLKATVIGGKKLVEVFAEKGGEAAWNKAQKIWRKIESKFGDDAELKGAALMVSAKPSEKDLQKLMIKALTAKLAIDPDLTQEILKAIGGENMAQTILTGEGSWVEDIIFEINGKPNGNIRQSLEVGKDAIAKNITIKNSNQ